MSRGAPRSAEQRKFRRTLIKFCVFVAISLLCGSVIYGTLLNDTVGSGHTYHAIFADVSGLQTGDPVRVSGVLVGNVTGVDLIDATHVDVAFTANHDQPITEATHAVVRYENLLGQRFLALTQTGPAGSTLKPGSTIPESHTAPAVSLTALFNGFRPLFQTLNVDQVNQLTGEIVQVLQGESGSIDELIAQTASLSSNLSDRSDVFASVIDNLSTLVTTVAKHDDQFASALDDLRTLTSQLANDSPAIGTALDVVDGLSSSLRTLIEGLTANGVTDAVTSLKALAATLAANSGTLDATIKAFPQAFGVLDRVTQSGSWINAYPCQANVKTIGTVNLTPDNVADALGYFLTGSNGQLLDTLLKVLGLANAAVPIPVQVPQGPVGNTSVHSAVC